jgi:hypothetical protein
MDTTRREFLSDVGKGMLVASVGAALAAELGLPAALAESGPARLRFGRLEPLASLMQETPPDRLMPLVVDRLSNGTDLREVVAAAALANARAFGGEDYVGFHAFMALVPALQMSKELPAERRALPVLKVLHRSTAQIQSKGAATADTLHPHGHETVMPAGGGALLKEAVRQRDLGRAESLFASMAGASLPNAYDELQEIVQDDADVHRVVLAYRAWDMLGLTGREHAHTTLRQSVRYCVSVEKGRVSRGAPEPGIRVALQKCLDKHGIVGRKPGTRRADDSWLREFKDLLLASTPDAAADAVAGAIAEGFSLETIGEALSLAATHQVLRDPGRTTAFPGKPVGSVHGDSVGVHASDSMNAWRNIGKVTGPLHSMTGLIVAGYHLAMAQGQDLKKRMPYPLEDHASLVVSNDPAALLAELDGAIRENHQARAAAVLHRYGKAGNAVPPALDILLRYATSEDGALHAEKYYRTVSEEYGRTRKAFRWDHVVALARVTASEYGKRADGYEQACALLKVKA